MSVSGSSPVFVHDTPLPFSDSKQKAFLGYVLDEHSGLFKYVQSRADEKWFQNPVAGLVFEAVKRYWAQHKKIPSHIELQEWPHLNRDVDMQTRMQSMIMQAFNERHAWNIAALKEETQIWMQAKILQEAGERAAAYFNNEKFSDAARCYEQGVKAYNDARVTLGNFKKATDFHELIAGQGRESVVRFGLTGIDNVFFPGNPKGGLRKGDQTLIMGATNQGKTSVLITTCIHNVINDQLALLVTHQGRDTDIRIKYIRCFINLMPIELLKRILLEPPKDSKFSDKELKAMADLALSDSTLNGVFSWLRGIGKDANAFLLALADVTFRYTILQRVMTWLDTRLVYASQHKAFLKVEEVIPVLERAQEECIDRHGRGFDMCADDYPGLLQTEMNSRGNYQARQVIDIVYEAFNQTGLAQNWHSLVAVQTNRDGSKKATGYDGIQYGGKPREIKFLRNEDIAEAWGPIMGAANVITINRSPDAQMQGMVTYYIAKSRSSKTGIAVSAYEDWQQAITHSDHLGWISYQLGHEDQRVITGFMKRGHHRELTLKEISDVTQNQGIDVNKVT